MAYVEDLGDTCVQFDVKTTRTNRQTGKTENITITFRLASTNGIVELEMNMNDGNGFKAAKKGKLNVFKKHVIQEILRHCGYENVTQNLDKLRMILYCICGIAEDPRTVFEKLFDQNKKNQIIKALKQEKLILVFTVYNFIKDSETLSITSFIQDSYSKLYANSLDELLSFIRYIWDCLLTIWIQHPTDDEFTDATFAFTNSYDDEKEYKELQKGFESLKNMDVFEWKDDDFSSLAFGLFIAVNDLFIHKVKQNIMEILAIKKGINNTGKQLNEEERYYLHQSVGGATWNSRLRTYYGGNFKAKKKAMLVAIMKSQLVTATQFTHARIAYRLTVEHQGMGFRIINEPTTAWVADIMGMVKPEMNNIVLWTNGNFKPLLQTLLENKSLRKDFVELFEYNTVLEIFNSLCGSKEDDSDADMKDNEAEMTKMEIFELYKNCLDRTFGDNVCGIFNRAAWGYLKQLKPPKDALTMRNRLRIGLNNINTKFSSLQIQQ